MQAEIRKKIVAQEIKIESTLFTGWKHLVRNYGARIALREPHSQPIVELTYAQVFEQALNFARGLQSLGVAPGDRVAIIVENSPRWLIADLGTLFANLVNVPRSANAPLPEIEYILCHSGSTVVILQDLKTWKQLQHILNELGIFWVILLWDEVQKGCFGFKDLLTLGRERYTMPKLQRSQLATIMIKAELQKHSSPRSLHVVSDFRFVPEPFSPDNGLTTQTLKIRRAKVEQHYAHLIDEMYR